MNRQEWLKARRRITEQRYDRLWAPIYDENWGGEIDPLHQRLVTQIVNTCPPGGTILDAACGTGKYWPILLASGRKFIGIDQSQAMLDRATSKYPQVAVQKLGLQEMPFQDVFDLILCMDAMEMIFPEDWPPVCANFHRALKQAGQLYFTVEIADDESIEMEYRSSLQRGLPVVYGEWVTGSGVGDDEGGYHFYPSMQQVREWLGRANFVIKEEAQANDYHHFWVQKG